jgi:DNA-binding winged helix-turn-helix (wHTH) protein
LRRVTIGPIELDPDGGEIWKNGVRSYLPEQPLSILQALIDARGGVVSREELRHRLWPNDTFVDFEHGVNAAVKRLREALGDSADSPQFIETIPVAGSGSSRRSIKGSRPINGLHLRSRSLTSTAVVCR